RVDSAQVLENLVERVESRFRLQHAHLRNRAYRFAVARLAVFAAPFGDGAAGGSFQLFAWRKNASGFSYTTLRMTLSRWPRRFISWMNSGTASGSDLPQSPAEFA